MLEIYNSSPKDQKNANDAMIHYFDMMMCVSSILSIREGSEERLKDKEKLCNPVLLVKSFNHN